MLVTLRRLWMIAAWLVVCVAVGPTASALCAHHEVVQQVEPCHETEGEMPMGHKMPSEPAPLDHHSAPDSVCGSMCCADLGGVKTVAVTMAPQADLPVLYVVVVEPPVARPVARRGAARDHPPPGPSLIETGRLRI